MHELYFITGTTNKEPEQLHGIEYNDPNFYPMFQDKIEWFKQTLIECNNTNKGVVFLRVYDGEFHFLNKRAVGNGPRRHFTKPLTNNFVKKFKEGCYNVDYISVQLNINMLNQYNILFPDRKMDFPMDIIYGLTANRWILDTFKNKIALIGGSEKMEVIKKLMKNEEYRSYIKNDYFLDYISVPERFSCDNTDELIKDIGQQISSSNAEVFLFGIGIAKMAIAYKFKEYKNAIFIDIGCGMSALAGTCGTDRPYFGSWINYRLQNYDYKNIDPMDFNITQDNTKYIS
jgi:hypothetical protein